MPLLPLLFALLLPLLLVLAVPFSLVQRYRIGTARRRGRSWVAAINLLLMLISVAFFIYAAALTNLWIHHTFRYAVLGVLGGMMLGLLGLSLTRWEHSPRGLHYTPNRWLVLFLTLAVSARIIYSLWRGWQTWHTSATTSAWLQQTGLALSLAIGGMVLGYYLAYAVGVLRRIKTAARLSGRSC